MRFPKCDEVEHNQSSFCESLISVHHYLGGRFKANTGSPSARLPSPKLQLRETALRSRTWPRGRHTMLCAGAAYSDLADRSNGTVRPPEGKPFVIQLGCLLGQTDWLARLSNALSKGLHSLTFMQCSRKTRRWPPARLSQCEERSRPENTMHHRRIVPEMYSNALRRPAVK